MQAMIGERISAMAFLSVPVLALLALSPVRSTSQARELSSLLAASTGVDAGSPSHSDNAAGEPITDLSDWSYTANPMSPVGKTTFSRRLLSNQPGPHPTPEGPNPRVPWIVRPASTGNGNFASADLAGLAVSAVQVLPATPALGATNSQGATSSQGTAGSTTQGNVQGSGTAKTAAAFDTAAVTSMLATLQNITATAAQPVITTPIFQPVKSKWQNRAARMKLGRGATP